MTVDTHVDYIWKFSISDLPSPKITPTHINVLPLEFPDPEGGLVQNFFLLVEPWPSTESIAKNQKSLSPPNSEN